MSHKILAMAAVQMLGLTAERAENSMVMIESYVDRDPAMRHRKVSGRRLDDKRQEPKKKSRSLKNLLKMKGRR
jgi:hypothetical protein